MSFVPFIRDYIDALNTAYDSISSHGSFSLLTIVQHTLVYLFESLKYISVYLLTFKWLKDLSCLPLILPQINQSLMRGNYFAENPLFNVFTFLEAPTYSNNKFFIGFLNSFFASLPFSVAHLLSVRRLLVEGIPAGIASALGTILGQCFFLVCMLFGYRLFVLPFISAEPFSYVIGILFVLNVILQITRQRSIKIIRVSQKLTLVRFFFINFFLTWCEQTTLFQFLGKLTINAEPSLFEVYSSGNITKPILVLGSYILGFLLGNLAITAAIGYILLSFHQYWLKWSAIGFSRSVNKINSTLLIWIVTFSLTSMPYHGIDFLIAKTAGFTSQDQSLEDTWFYSATLPDIPSQFNQMDKSNATVDIDLNSFDRGRYMPFTFEEETSEDRKLLYNGMKDLGSAKPIPSSEKSTISIPSGTPEVKNVTGGKDNKMAKGGREDLSAVSENTGKNNTFKTPQQALAIPPLQSPHSFETLHFEGENAWLVRRWHQCDDSFQSGFLGRMLFPRLERWSRKIEREPTKKGSVLSLFSRLKRESPQNESLSCSIYASREGLLPWDSDETLLNEFQEEENTAPSEDLMDALNHFKTLNSKGRENLLKSGPTDPLEKDELFQANFSSKFHSGFSPFFYTDSLEEDKFPYEHFVKENYYASPLFRGLLTVDIDSFLSRQPRGHLLSRGEEKQLFVKRQLLGKYYDTLRYYDNFARGEENSSFYKSFADRVYSQQFKGTLKIARRLFSITADPEQNTQNKRVLKFDQPLFDKSPSKRDSLFHEELPIQNVHRESEKVSKRGEKEHILENNGMTDSLGNILEDNKKELPFIEETNPTPFYAGWDDQLRKFVITNRMLNESQLFE